MTGTDREGISGNSSEHAFTNLKEGKQQTMFSINSKSSPILPIRIIHEPQSDMLGLRVSPFSALEQKHDEAGAKRLTQETTDAPNILSPAAVIGS